MTPRQLLAIKAIVGLYHQRLDVLTEDRAEVVAEIHERLPGLSLAAVERTLDLSRKVEAELFDGQMRAALIEAGFAFGLAEEGGDVGLAADGGEG